MNNYSFQSIDNKHTWEAFLDSHPEANFLQSWNWGAFHQSLDKQVFYLGVFQEKKLIGTALIVKEQAKRGNYLTIAGGPLIDWQDQSLASSLISHLKTLSQQHDCLFIRLRPQINDTSNNRKLFTSLGLSLSPMHLTADLTLQLDLSQSEEELLSGMRKNCRYDIRKADKLGITVKTSADPEDIRQFHQLQLDLAKKHNFVPFTYDWLYHQFTAFSQDNQALLFHSYLDDKLLASAFIIFYGQEAAYHYGISTPDNLHLPGSHAALWAAIKESRSRGQSRFNLWGIAPKDQAAHRFAGVSLFKRGFGGQEIAYLPAHDLPTSPLYIGTKLFETLRSKSRKLS